MTGWAIDNSNIVSYELCDNDGIAATWKFYDEHKRLVWQAPGRSNMAQSIVNYLDIGDVR